MLQCRCRRCPPVVTAALLPRTPLGSHGDPLRCSRRTPPSVLLLALPGRLEACEPRLCLRDALVVAGVTAGIGGVRACAGGGRVAAQEGERLVLPDVPARDPEVPRLVLHEERRLGTLDVGVARGNVARDALALLDLRVDVGVHLDLAELRGARHGRDVVLLGPGPRPVVVHRLHDGLELQVLVHEVALHVGLGGLHLLNITFRPARLEQLLPVVLLILLAG
mmetsp:Transcript_10834/g.32902  ORF Transcript_10834/g.32902 Transcript_10834/m.32902 type:complete len:222 (+) Transcript_10834:399-1064(+)